MRQYCAGLVHPGRGYAEDECHELRELPGSIDPTGRLRQADAPHLFVPAAEHDFEGRQPGAAVSSYLIGKVPSRAAQFGALVSGYQSAFLWAALIIFAAAPIAFFLVRPRREDLLGTGPAVHLG